MKARTTQAERRARTRDALLEAAARGLSRDGYGNLVLEQVAREAGYTRGALYHLFADKESLALAVVGWVEETWYDDLGHLFEGEDPVDALLAVARGHAIYCRRDVARVMMSLGVEFSGQDHPVARAVRAVATRIVEDCARLIAAGRREGTIPPGPSPRRTAVAFLGALDGLLIHLRDAKPPLDVEMAERVARGVLGLGPA